MSEIKYLPFRLSFVVRKYGQSLSENESSEIKILQGTEVDAVLHFVDDNSSYPKGYYFPTFTRVIPLNDTIVLQPKYNNDFIYLRRNSIKYETWKTSYNDIGNYTCTKIIYIDRQFDQNPNIICYAINPNFTVYDSNTVVSETNILNMNSTNLLTIYNNVINSIFDIGEYSLKLQNPFLINLQVQIKNDKPTNQLTFEIPNNFSGTFVVGLNDYQVFNSKIQLIPYCFLKGTMINGTRIEDLQIGQEILVYPNEIKKIKTIVKSQLIFTKENSELNSLFLEPNSNLICTGGHSFLVDELTEEQRTEMKKYWNEPKMIEDKYLLLTCCNEKCIKYTEEGIYDLFHIVIEDINKTKQFGIWANGILADTMSIDFYDRNFSKCNLLKNEYGQI